jgi:hypothetical protein
MKKLKNVLIVVLCGIAVFAMVLLLYAKLTLTPEKVRQTLAAEVSHYLRRDISFKEIQVGWLGGILLKGVILHKSFPWEEDDILACPELRIQVRLIPLLLGKLFIKEVVFQEPHIALFQRELGQYISVYGQIQRRKSISTGSQQQPFSVVFLPTHLEVRGGSVLLKSTARELPQPITVSLADVRMLITDVSPLFAFPFTISAQVAGTQPSVFSCNGEVSVPRQKLTATISLGNTDLSAFKEYFKFYQLPVKSGVVKLDAKLELEELKTLKASGAVQLQDVAVGIASFVQNGAAQDVMLEGADATLNFAALWNIAQQVITFQKLDGTVLSASYTGEGTVKGIGETPYLKMVLKAEDFPLENFFKRLSAKMPWMLDGASLSGKADMTVNIEGEMPDSVFTKFSINFKGNRLNYKPLGGFQPDLEGSGTVDNNRIALRDLKIGVRGSTITLAGEVLNYLKGTPQSDIRIVASHIKLSDFMLTGASAEDAEKEEVGPFDLKGLTFGGPIDMGSVAFLGMLVNNLRGNYMLADNQLSLKELTGTIGQGQFRLSGAVNLGVKGLDYSLDFNLDRASFKELSKIISPMYENFVDGTISGNCTVKGNGVTPLRFVKNLEGKGFFTVQNALFKGLSLGTIGSFMRMDGGDGLRFDQGQVQLKLRDGTVDVNGGFVNPDLGLYPTGSIGFDSSLNIDTVMKLSPAFSRRMMSEKILQYFPQEDGWISLPVEIRGTVYEPQISLSKEVLNIFIEKVMPAVLNEMLKEKQGQGSTGGPSE